VITYLREHCAVHALVRAIPESPLSGVNYHPVDFGENWSTHDLPESIDTAIHLAQSAHFREFPEKALDVFRVNVASTALLLDYAYQKRVQRFIYASSGGVYGSGSVAFDENAPIMPPGQLGYYLGSKLCGEVLAQNYAQFMKVIVLRFFFMYGPGQKRSMLIPRLIDNIKDRRAITIEGEQGIRINPVHVSDATKALVSAITLEQSATFNIGGTEVLSLRKICDIIGEYLNIAPKYVIKAGAPQDLIGDITAMKEQLCMPQVRIAEGIKDLIVNNDT
jgi:nucleoside-diphosphate-sugar epimerase